MFVPPDSWALTVMAWMKKSSTIPKVIGVEIPVQESALYYSPPPRPPRTTLGMYLYQVLMHVEKVVNPSIEVLQPPLVPGSVDDVHYRSQHQTFPVLLGIMDVLHRVAEATTSLGEEAGLAAWMFSNLR